MNMKAIVFERYGGPEHLTLQDVEKPTPKASQVLIKIDTASVNPLDWRIMRGSPFLVRLMFGLTKPKFNRLGADVSGIVEEVGSDVKNLKVGDEVFGEIFKSGLGAFSEYVCADEKLLVKKPKEVSFDQVAAIPVAGLTGLQGLRIAGEITHGQKVLVNGASGGVGSYAVQLAREMGAHVTGVCSTKNVEMVESIGADNVIDYTQTDIGALVEKFDYILDTVGNLSVQEYQHLLKPVGTAVVIGFTTGKLMFQVQIIGAMRSTFSTQKIKTFTAQMDQNDLSYLADLMVKGKIKSVIDRTYTLEETDKAIRYVETKHAKGKVLIKP